MISSDIQCAYCGLWGKIEGYESDDDTKIFKLRGHNPFSGHLHFQCPSCSVVELVLPMDILEGRVLNGFPSQADQEDFLGRLASRVSDWLTEFRRTLLARLPSGAGRLAERQG